MGSSVLPPTVDMSSGSQGYIEFRNGQKLWAATILHDKEVYRIRLDIGFYHEVDRNGRTRLDKETPHDVVRFDPKMKWLESKKHYIPSEIRLC